MKISIDNEVLNHYEGLKIGIIIFPEIRDYSTCDDRNTFKKQIISSINNLYLSQSNLENAEANKLYRNFYQRMGLKYSKVSTPIKQVKRLLRTQNFNSIYKIIDLYLQTEYKTLVSFQAYDYDKIQSDLVFKFSRGQEVIKTSREETKTCKKGELILLKTSNEFVCHSSYYGNNKEVSLEENTNSVLIRVLGVEGMEENFKAAFEEAKSFFEESTSVILDKMNPTCIINS